jgi:hypothetical protein
VLGNHWNIDPSARTTFVSIIGRERDELADAAARYTKLGLTAEVVLFEGQVEVLERYDPPLP